MIFYARGKVLAYLCLYIFVAKQLCFVCTYMEPCEVILIGGKVLFIFNSSFIFI